MRVRPRRNRRPVQPPPVHRHAGTPGRGLPPDSDRHAGPRYHEQHEQQLAHRRRPVGSVLLARRHHHRGQPVHQLSVAHPSGRRFPVYSEGHHAAAEQSARAELSAQLDQAAALSPGAAGIFLEDLRL
uniref:(northern house mosquito) hypothetical protein n=1 Tax=Culex pipiens TaxID=7175 RepID=A0A8D8DP03_CULPI